MYSTVINNVINGIDLILSMDTLVFLDMSWDHSSAKVHGAAVTGASAWATARVSAQRMLHRASHRSTNLAALWAFNVVLHSRPLGWRSGHESRADEARCAAAERPPTRGTMNSSRSSPSGRLGKTTTQPCPTLIPPCNMHRGPWQTPGQCWGGFTPWHD